DVATFRIGRMNRQTAITNRFAGIADAQIVNLVTIREPPHDAVHHPRQTGAVGVEADGYDFGARAGMTHRGTVASRVASRSCGATSRVAKNNPSPGIARAGFRGRRWGTVNPASLRCPTSTSMVIFSTFAKENTGSFAGRSSLISRNCPPIS